MGHSLLLDHKSVLVKGGFVDHATVRARCPFPKPPPSTLHSAMKKWFCKMGQWSIGIGGLKRERQRDREKKTYDVAYFVCWLPCVAVWSSRRRSTAAEQNTFYVISMLLHVTTVCLPTTNELLREANAQFPGKPEPCNDHKGGLSKDIRCEQHERTGIKSHPEQEMAGARSLEVLVSKQK